MKVSRDEMVTGVTIKDVHVDELAAKVTEIVGIRQTATKNGPAREP
jgi:hypothetical protein